MGMIQNTIQNITGLFSNTVFNIFETIDWFIGDYTISVILSLLIIYTPIVFVVTKLLLENIYSPYKIIFIDIFVSVFIGAFSVNEFNSYNAQLDITILTLVFMFVIGMTGRFLMGPLFSGILNREN